MLALELGQTWGFVQQIPNEEYVRWRAFMLWCNVELQHRADVQTRRAGL